MAQLGRGDSMGMRWLNWDVVAQLGRGSSTGCGGSMGAHPAVVQ